MWHVTCVGMSGVGFVAVSTLQCTTPRSTPSAVLDYKEKTILRLVGLVTSCACCDFVFSCVGLVLFWLETLNLELMRVR
jgi:hypothetical protein